MKLAKMGKLAIIDKDNVQIVCIRISCVIAPHSQI